MSPSPANGGVYEPLFAGYVLAYYMARTVCTPDYGDCGCDNCKGVFEDISNRMDEFALRERYETLLNLTIRLVIDFTVCKT